MRLKLLLALLLHGILSQAKSRLSRKDDNEDGRNEVWRIRDRHMSWRTKVLSGIEGGNYNQKYKKISDRNDADHAFEDTLVARRPNKQRRKPKSRKVQTEPSFEENDEEAPEHEVNNQEAELIEIDPSSIIASAKSRDLSFIENTSNNKKLVKAADCDRINERFDSCFSGCAAVSCDNPRDRLRPCYPFCEPGCVCADPYVRDERTHKCVLPDDCTMGLQGIPAPLGLQGMPAPLGLQGMPAPLTLQGMPYPLAGQQ